MPSKDDDKHVVSIGEHRQPNVLLPVKEQAPSGSRPARGVGSQRYDNCRAEAEVGAGAAVQRAEGASPRRQAAHVQDHARPSPHGGERRRAVRPSGGDRLQPRMVTVCEASATGCATLAWVPAGCTTPTARLRLATAPITRRIVQFLSLIADLSAVDRACRTGNEQPAAAVWSVGLVARRCSYHAPRGTPLCRDTLLRLGTPLPTFHSVGRHEAARAHRPAHTACSQARAVLDSRTSLRHVL